ncbi:MAG: hypothetical protein J6I62_02250 [Selenomonadaceae bacterium]|nr:hypothetical protein [Selenomonadaceae bacterium]
MKMDIRNLESDSPVQPKVFEAFTGEDNQIYLKVKKEKSHETVLWDDVLYQMNKFKNKIQRSIGIN